MSKWYWKLYDAAVWCGLALVAVFVVGVLAFGAVKVVEHHHHATTSRAQ